MTAPTINPAPPDVTRTCQPDGFTTAALVAALEAGWAAIRAQHGEVPAAVIVVGSGSPASASQSMKWGHFARLRWQSGDTELPEVLISGEGLSRSAGEVFTTLLHEAVHGLADARGVQDTSRQGRWHNQRFAKLAAELGLAASKDPKLGFSPCTLTNEATARYAGVIDELGRALRAYRHPDLRTGNGRTNQNNGVACECDCPRKLRLARSVLAAGPILCVVCGHAFLPDGIDRDSYESELTNLLAGITGSTTTTTSTTTAADGEDDDPMVFYDPTGARYGLPTYPYRMAPTGLATRRQLRADGLCPGRQPIAAQILWRRGDRKAHLYRIDLARPKRPATVAQLAALQLAERVLRTCTTCEQVKPYRIPRRFGECLDCAPAMAVTAVAA